MRTLIDSNVLMRAHDLRPSPYSAAAVKMLEELAKNGTGVLSAQSLAEFAHYTTVEHESGARKALAQINRLTKVFPVLPVTAVVVKRALLSMYKFPLDYYDAQVWAMARTNGIERVVTEGLWHKFERDKVDYYDLNRQALTFGWVPNR